MRPWRAGVLITVALLTQAATITLTNETFPRASPKPVQPGTVAVADGAATAWLSAINRQRVQQSLAAVELDPVLSEAARRQASIIAQWPANQRTTIPAKPLMEAFWAAGGTDGNPSWRIVGQAAGGSGLPPADFRLGPPLQGDISHIGVGSVERSGTRWTVLVVVKRRLQLAGNLTGVRHPYDRLYLRGRLLPGFSKPHLMVTRPDGHVQDVAMQLADVQFEHLLELDGTKGRYMVEIMVDSRWGPAVASLFPIDVGQAYRPRASTAADDGKLSLEGMRQRMLGLINADRATFHVAPVALNDRLNRMAQHHSDDMQQHGFFAHTSPQYGSLEDRVRAAGIAPMTMGENIAVAGSLAEAEEGLMASPAHRSMILDPDMTVVGIGITFRDGGGRGPAKYWVTQNYGVHAPD